MASGFGRDRVNTPGVKRVSEGCHKDAVKVQGLHRPEKVVLLWDQCLVRILYIRKSKGKRKGNYNMLVDFVLFLIGFCSQESSIP